MAAALFITLVGMAVSWLFLFTLVGMTRGWRRVKCMRVAERPTKAPKHAGSESEVEIAVAVAVAMGHAGA